MARVKRPRQYDKFIAAVMKDLGLQDVKIEWRSTMRKLVAGSAYRDINTIRIYRHMSDRETMRVLAHELRHLWQFNTGIFPSSNVWDGVKYDSVVRVKRGYSPTAYEAQPWEKDANTYAATALDRFENLFDSSALFSGTVDPVLFLNGKINYRATAIKAKAENTSPYFKGVDRKKMKRAIAQLGY